MRDPMSQKRVPHAHRGRDFLCRQDFLYGSREDTFEPRRFFGPVVDNLKDPGTPPVSSLGLTPPRSPSHPTRLRVKDSSRHLRR